MAKERQRDSLKLGRFRKTFRHTPGLKSRVVLTPEVIQKNLDQVARLVDIEFRTLVEYLNNILPNVLLAPRPSDPRGDPPPPGGSGLITDREYLVSLKGFPDSKNKGTGRIYIGAPLELINNAIALNPTAASGLEVSGGKLGIKTSTGLKLGSSGLVFAFTTTGIKTGDYTVGLNEIVLVDPSSGDFILTLPVTTSLPNGQLVIIKNVSSSGVITITSTDNIDGESSRILEGALGCWILARATGEWKIIASYKDSPTNNILSLTSSIDLITPSSADGIPFNIEQKKNGQFTHSILVNNDEITLDKDGTVEVSFSASFEAV